MFSLIYHDVAPRGGCDATGFPGALAARYKLTPQDFARHLDAIASTGVSVGTVDDEPWPAAALTFDDGGASSLHIAEELERHGWRGHFFITTGRVGSAGFLSPAGVRELAQRGHVVGSHSRSHPTYMGKLSRAELADEWRRSRDDLGDMIGCAPRTAAVPGGFLSEDLVHEAERAGYEVLMTSNPVSRVRHVQNMAVLGRFSIWSSTRASTAAGYVSTARWSRARLWLEWTGKQRVKRVSPRLYETGRYVRARTG